jgi:hypothetical protein
MAQTNAFALLHALLLLYCFPAALFIEAFDGAGARLCAPSCFTAALLLHCCFTAALHSEALAGADARL